MNKSVHQLAQEALWKRFKEVTGKEIDAKGYVGRVEDNLLPGVTLEMFQDDLKAGSGNELESKFKAVHSSSALAANTFAPFKKSPGKLILAGKTGFIKIQFEKQCPTGLGGTPPNLDLVAESENDVVGVESKFLEYLTLKKPHFAVSYIKENLPQIEDCWLDLIGELKNSDPQFLNAAQLVKHYLGLRKQYPNKNITLLYLFWEPENWQDFEVFRKHRKEIGIFAGKVQESAISFDSQSYADLWDDFAYNKILINHTNQIKKKYLVNIN